jgi:hypothetical protein
VPTIDHWDFVLQLEQVTIGPVPTRFALRPHPISISPHLYELAVAYRPNQVTAIANPDDGVFDDAKGHGRFFLHLEDGSGTGVLNGSLK